MNKSVLDVLKVKELQFRKTIAHRIATVKPGVNKRCANGASHIKVKNTAYATKNMNVVEACTRDRRDKIREDKRRQESKMKPMLQAEAVEETDWPLLIVNLHH